MDNKKKLNEYQIEIYIFGKERTIYFDSKYTLKELSDYKLLEEIIKEEIIKRTKGWYYLKQI